MNSPLAILHRHLGEYEKKKDENYAFYCPFCKHHKKKLEINLTSGKWSCWVCRTSGLNLNSLFYRLEITVDSSLLHTGSTQKREHTSDFIYLPKEYEFLLECENNIEKNAALYYLNSRSITEFDIEKYKIGICTTGQYKGCLIFPSYDSQAILNYFVAKNFRTGFYINPPHSKNQIIYDLFINWSENIILTEGIFDAIAIENNVIPLLGKTLNQKIKTSILSNSNKNYYICLDSGKRELIDSFKIADYLVNAGKNVYITKLPENKDAASVGKNKVWEYIKESQKITSSDIFKFKIKNDPTRHFHSKSR